MTMQEDAGTSELPGGRDNLAPGTLVGDYLVEGFLGEGGMATVYAGRHPIIGRRVAIKVIRRRLCQSVEAVERFIQEARAVTEIGHPNIVDVFNFGTLPDGRCYFVMEWLKGRTLADILDSSGPLTLPQAVSALSQICDALEAAHRAGIVHRDLKPQNVFFLDADSGRRDLKLLDFGIAKLINRPEGRTTQTQPGLTMGTPDYISPEQARGRAIDGAADVYSLGVLAFEMLTGQLPFVADNAADMMAMHLSAAPRIPSSVMPALPAAVDALVARMLEKSAQARPTPADVRVALVMLLMPPRTASPMAKRFASASFRRVAVAGVAALCGIALIPSERQSDALLPALTTLSATPVLVPGELASPPPALLPPAAPPAGELVIQATPGWATVLLDGQRLPVDAGAARQTLSSPGQHLIAVSAPGHQTVRLDVTVDGRATVVVPVTLPRVARPTPPASKTYARSGGDLYTVDPWSGGR